MLAHARNIPSVHGAAAGSSMDADTGAAARAAPAQQPLSKVCHRCTAQPNVGLACHCRGALLRPQECCLPWLLLLYGCCLALVDPDATGIQGLCCCPRSRHVHVPLFVPDLFTRACADQVDSLVATHSITQDKAERYLLAANDDLAAAHRLLQTSRVGMRRALRWVLSSQCQ